MRGSKDDLPVVVDIGTVVIRQADWGEMSTSLEQMSAGLETAPIFRGLPDGRCQCPHWGYVVSGRFRAIYKDREETFSTGDLYYLPPGHTTAFDVDTEIVEFSPRALYQETIEVAGRNVAAMMAGAQQSAV